MTPCYTGCSTTSVYGVKLLHDNPAVTCFIVSYKHKCEVHISSFTESN